MAAADTELAWQGAACGLLTTSHVGAIERANATFCGWLGESADALVGRRFQDLLTVGSRLFHYTHWLPLLQLQGSISEVSLELVGKNKRAIPVLVNAVQREGEDRLRNPIDIAVFVATDRRTYERELLAARRRAEELLERERAAQDALRKREQEFRALAENSPAIIVRFDRERRPVYRNPLAQRIASDERRVRVGGAVRAAAIDGALRGEEQTLELVFDVDGAERVFLARLVPERDGSGAVESVLAIAYDVTALREREHEAKERVQLAEQFIGIVSHDLRNPLSAIAMGAEVLRRRVTGPDLRTVERIVNASVRSRRLIDDLLDFTQARLGGGLRVSLAPVDVHAIAGSTLDEIRLATEGRTLVHRVAGDGMAHADAGRLAQVLTNLVRNALAYGAPDAPITVTTATSGDSVELQVHNEGAPIPAELQVRIFEPMQRGPQTVSAGARSVGLGLYIVQQIALSHGGRVTVQSSEAEGTTFVVAFPRAPRT